jgi:hypothetical protein
MASLFVYGMFGYVLHLYTSMFTAANFAAAGLLAIMVIMIMWFGYILRLGGRVLLRCLQFVTAIWCLWQAYSVSSWDYQFFWCLAYVGAGLLLLFFIVDHLRHRPEPASAAPASYVLADSSDEQPVSYGPHFDDILNGWQPTTG